MVKWLRAVGCVPLLPEVCSMWPSEAPEDVHGDEDDEEDEVHEEEVAVDEVGVVRSPEVSDNVAERGQVG